MPETTAAITHAATKPAYLPRRGRSCTIPTDAGSLASACEPERLRNWEKIDLVYRALCAILYNFVPTSGHPGGSISSGRIVQCLIYQSMLYDFMSPDRPDNDIISYAAGHKAMGLYA